MALRARSFHRSSLYTLLAVLLLTTAVAAIPVSAPAPTSTSTPLPFNGTYTCNFTSRAELIDRVTLDHWNATKLVRDCEVCVLAYGTGNPDISGVGVMVSLILQAGLTFLFGPLLCTLDLFQTPIQRKTPSPLFASLKRIQIVITDANAFLGITILIAAFVRLEQHPPIFEITFLKYLSGLMVVLIVTSALSQVILNIRRIPRRLTIAAYNIIAFVILLYILRLAGVPQAELNAYREIVAECHSSQGYQDPGIQGQASLIYSPRRSELIPIGGVMLGIILISAILAVWYKQRNGPKHLSDPKGSRDLKRRWSKYIRLRAFHGLLLALTYLTTILLGLGFWQAQAARWLLRRAIGSNYQDNQWGFGQVTAVLIPAPIIVAALHEIHGAVFKESKLQPSKKEDAIDLGELEIETKHNQETTDHLLPNSQEPTE